MRGPSDDVLHAGLELVEREVRRPRRGVLLAAGENPLGQGQREAGAPEAELDGMAGGLCDLHPWSSSPVSRAGAGGGPLFFVGGAGGSPPRGRGPGCPPPRLDAPLPVVEGGFVRGDLVVELL